VELIPKELWQNVVVLLKQEFLLFLLLAMELRSLGKEVRGFNGKCRSF
jgi:hypothetical protein